MCVCSLCCLSYVPERFKLSCTVDWASQDRLDRSYIICIFVFCYLVPLAGLLGSYIAIARKIFNHRSLILKQHTSHFTHFWTEVRLIKVILLALGPIYDRNELLLKRKIQFLQFALICNVDFIFCSKLITFPDVNCRDII